MNLKDEAAPVMLTAVSSDVERETVSFQSGYRESYSTGLESQSTGTDSVHKAIRDPLAVTWITTERDSGVLLGLLGGLYLFAMANTGHPEQQSDYLPGILMAGAGALRRKFHP